MQPRHFSLFLQRVELICQVSCFTLLVPEFSALQEPATEQVYRVRKSINKELIMYAKIKMYMLKMQYSKSVLRSRDTATSLLIDNLLL